MVGVSKVLVDPSNPEISPSFAPWKSFKNEYYEKRGYTVASKDWKVCVQAGRPAASGERVPTTRHPHASAHSAAMALRSVIVVLVVHLFCVCVPCAGVV